MIKALLLILAPDATWQRIAQARRGLGFILLCYILPLVGLSAAGEAYGLIHWGKWQGPMARLKHFSPVEVLGFEAVQILLALVIVFLSAWLVRAFGQTFHSRHTYRQTFTLVAYGVSPVFLLRLLNAFPAVSPWVSWAIGIILAMTLLYRGLPRVMDPDPPQAFGLFLLTALLVVVITGLARLVTALYLQGRFTRLEPLVSALSGRLHV